jgi:AAA domain
VTDPVADSPEPTRPERFAAKLLTVAALLTMEPPEPLIGDLLAHNTLAVLYGPPGSYKTFVALDWALCVAGGLPWQGREVRAGPVLYVAAEGSAGLGARVEAWVEGFRADPPGRFRAYPDTVNLREAGQRDTLAEWATTDRPGLVVFDTLARSMVGGDENSARDMGELIDGAEQVRAASGATVLLVHHTTKDGTSIRGSSACRAPPIPSSRLRPTGDWLHCRAPSRRMRHRSNRSGCGPSQSNSPRARRSCSGRSRDCKLGPPMNATNRPSCRPYRPTTAKPGRATRRCVKAWASASPPSPER